MKPWSPAWGPYTPRPPGRDPWNPWFKNDQLGSSRDQLRLFLPHLSASGWWPAECQVTLGQMDFKWFQHGNFTSVTILNCRLHRASKRRSLDADLRNLFDGWKARMAVGRRFTALWMLQSATGESRQLETPAPWNAQNGPRFVYGTHNLWKMTPDVLGAILGHIKYAFPTCLAYSKF